MKYKVEIREVLSKVIEVEAETKDEALQSARRAYDESKVILTADDYECTNMEVL